MSPGDSEVLAISRETHSTRMFDTGADLMDQLALLVARWHVEYGDCVPFR